MIITAAKAREWSGRQKKSEKRHYDAYAVCADAERNLNSLRFAIDDTSINNKLK